MLYYTALFLVVFFVSVVAIWMYRAIFGAGRSVYKSKTHGAKKSSKRAKARLEARRKQWAQSGSYLSSSDAPNPWGLKGQAPHPKAGQMGSYAESREPVSSRQTGGWPYKEEKVEFAGKAYKVNRKATDDKGMGSEGKPWVW